jgi:hypothetical protein
VATEHAICVNRINGDDLDSTYRSDNIPALLEYRNTTGFSNVVFYIIVTSEKDTRYY